MKINGFEVECELQVAEEAGTLTGWFEVPSIPHTRYTIEINVELLLEDALTHDIELGKICGTCGLERLSWVECEISECPNAVEIEEDERLNAILAAEAAGEDPKPHTDGTASDEDAPVKETEQVQMPDGKVEAVLPDVTREPGAEP